MRRWALVALVMVWTLAARADSPRAKVGIALRGARASLKPDGPWLPHATLDRRRLEIRDERRTRPQFIEHAAGVTLFLYVDRAALATCVLPGAELDGVILERTRCTDEPMVPGAPLHLRWTWDAGAIELRGKLAAAKLATIVTAAAAEPSETEFDVSLPKSYRVLAEPGGKPLISGPSPVRLRAQKLARKGPHTLVRTELGPVGWIETRELGALGVNGESGGIVGGALGSSGLAPGTKLFDAIRGNVIGEVEGRFDAPATAQRNGWSRFAVPTRFGVIEVWAPSPRARPVAKTPPTEDLMNLDPGKLEPLQLTGSIHIEPDAATKAAIAAARKRTVIASHKLCVDTKGRVSDVQVTRSSGFAQYDADIDAALRNWTFRPYRVNGKPVKVCTGTTVVYRATR